MGATLGLQGAFPTAPCLKGALLSAQTHADPSACSNQASWRKANLTCKLAIDNVEKAELLQGGDRLRQRYVHAGLCPRRQASECGPDALATTDHEPLKNASQFDRLEKWGLICPWGSLAAGFC